MLVAIIDEDDEPPCFTTVSPLAIIISENTKAGTVIVNPTDVAFSDPDTSDQYLEFNLACELGYVVLLIEKDISVN